MPKFKVYAEHINPADRKYFPEWETEVLAAIMGEALEQGGILFHKHCEEHQLDRAKFEVRVGTP